MTPRLLIVTALLASGAASAQTVSASVDRSTLAVGDRLAFTVTVEGNGADGAVIDPPDAEGLSLASRMPAFRALSSVNGRSTLTLRWLYVAERAGAGRLRGARVVVGGRTLRTDDIEVTIAAGAGPAAPAPASPGRAPDADIYVRAVPRSTAPFVGEQVVVDYVLYFRRHVEPRSAQFVGAWQADGLWREELDVPPSSRTPQYAGDGYWSVTVRRVALYPTRSGDVALGPLTFEIELLRREANPFGLFGAYSSRVERATPAAPAVELTARPLPPGAPAGFAGAVGRFRLEASLDRAGAEVGEPLRLTAVAEGTGNLATLPPLPINAPASFERFDPDEERELDRAGAPAVGRRTWTWALVPRSGGSFEVGASLVYFDPEREGYRTLEVGPLAVEVEGAVDPIAVAADGPAPPMAPTAWVRAPAERPSGAWLLAGAALPLLALAGVAASSRARRPRRAPAPRPLAAARAALRDDAPAFHRAIGREMEALAGDAAAAPGVRAGASELVAGTERALYAPAPGPDLAERTATLERAERLLESARGRR